MEYVDESPGQAFDEVVDVVVAGSGGGITGAYTAAREGLTVALLEATGKFGGTTAYSGGGGMWFPANPVLRRAGCDDTAEEALAYFRAVVGDRTPAALQEAYVRGGAGLVEYLESDPNFEFAVLPWPDYFGSVPSARTDGMRHIIAAPLEAVWFLVSPTIPPTITTSFSGKSASSSMQQLQQLASFSVARISGWSEM